MVSRTHAPGRRGAHLETGRDLGERLALVEAAQHEQGLLYGIQAPPSGTGVLAVGADSAGGQVQGAT